MTVRIKTELYSKEQDDWLPYIAVVHPDGALTFEDFDENYEILAVSLGEDPTPRYNILMSWRDGTSTSLFLNAYYGLRIDELELIWLTLDYCEKTMKKVYASEFPYDPRPMEIIDDTRELIDSYRRPCSESEREKLIDKLRYNVIESAKLMEASNRPTVGTLPYVAAHGLWRVIKSLPESVGIQNIRNLEVSHLIDACTDSQSAMAHFLSDTQVKNDSDPKYHAEFDKQNYWIRRRFHDILAEIRRSKEWPPLGATP